ncbi:MAG: molybdopterin-dependent oxidoreductase [Desulfarculus sp.]|nr:molybdopterin-dependent oxidoreductase [Desulfarculus sp.]
MRKGDPQAALARAAVVVTNTYTTSRAEHAAIEPEGGRAWIEDGLVVVQASTQNPHHDRHDLARLLGLPEDKVRVIQAETGGGFGGKLDLGLQGFLALAAWRLGRPVVMTYTREESLACTAKRHGLVMEYTSAADEQGRLLLCQAEIFGDSGVYASYGPAVCVRAAVHATGPYRVPHVEAHSRLVYTNNAWCGAMRGFGVPQVALAHEGQLDELAQRLGPASPLRSVAPRGRLPGGQPLARRGPGGHVLRHRQHGHEQPGQRPPGAGPGGAPVPVHRRRRAGPGLGHRALPDRRPDPGLARERGAPGARRHRPHLERRGHLGQPPDLHQRQRCSACRPGVARPFAGAGRRAPGRAAPRGRPGP